MVWRFRQNGRLVSEESSVFPTFSPHLRFFREKIGPVFFRTKGQEFFLSEVRDRKSLNKKIAAGNILPTKICVSLLLHHKHTRRLPKNPTQMSSSVKTNIFTLHMCRGVHFHTRFGLKAHGEMDENAPDRTKHENPPTVRTQGAL